MMTDLRPQKWQMGTVFLPDSVGYLLGTHLLGEPALWLGRWRVASAALLLLGVSAALVSTPLYLSTRPSTVQPHRDLLKIYFLRQSFFETLIQQRQSMGNNALTYDVFSEPWRN